MHVGIIKSSNVLQKNNSPDTENFSFLFRKEKQRKNLNRKYSFRCRQGRAEYLHFNVGFICYSSIVQSEIVGVKKTKDGVFIKKSQKLPYSPKLF